ncbi:hypothetical protein ACFQ2Y_00520 [Streptomyces malaysiensis subsp. malaysiensis]
MATAGLAGPGRWPMRRSSTSGCAGGSTTAVSNHDPAERVAAIELARGRLDELNNVTRACGHPFHPAAALPEAIEAMPDGWLSSWHPAT